MMIESDLEPVCAGELTVGLAQPDREAIMLIASGCTGKEMAARLGMTEPALRLRLTSLYDKLGVSNELDLLLCALYHGLIENDQPLD